MPSLINELQSIFLIVFVIIIISASAHVQCNTLGDYMAIANQLKEFFHNEGIHSTTIQPEFIEQPEICEGDEAANGQVIKDCILECDPDCAERMCCTTAATPPTVNSNGQKNKGDLESVTVVQNGDGPKNAVAI